MGPKPNVRTERRSQILEAATKVFSRLGFKKARMDDIVEESGLSKGTLYWYFKSKDEIIEGIISSFIAIEMEKLRQLQEAEGSVADRLTAFTEFVIADFERLTPLLPLFLEFLGLIARHKSIQILFTRYLHDFLSVLTPIIQEGVDTGEFRQLNAEEAAIAMGGILEGIMVLRIYDPEKIDIVQHTRTSFDIFLQGLLAKEVEAVHRGI
jgi:AcrR family transcriptional regulator